MGFNPNDSVEGFKKGKHFKFILNHAFEIQMEGAEKQEILEFILKEFADLKAKKKVLFFEGLFALINKYFLSMGSTFT